MKYSNETKVRSRNTGKTLTINCTETYFQAGLSKMRQGHPFNQAFKNLKVYDRERLFEFLCESVPSGDRVR